MNNQIDAIGGMFDIWRECVENDADVIRDDPELDVYSVEMSELPPPQESGRLKTESKEATCSLTHKLPTTMKRELVKKSRTESIFAGASTSLSGLFRITPYSQEIIHDLVESLPDMHLSVVYAVEEADFYIALYCNEGKAFACVTTDTDQIAYGSPLQVIKADHEGLRVRYIPLVKEELGITQEQLRTWCILLGTDYGERIRGIGPVNALKVARGEKIPPSNDDLENISNYTYADEMFSSASGFEYIGGPSYKVEEKDIWALIGKYVKSE